MTKDEALNLALEALENISTALREEDVLGSDIELMLNAAAAIRVALAQPAQEPEWYHGVDQHGCNRFYHKTEVRPTEFSTPLYTTPPLPVQERNFCQRCGKRTADLTTIHTCTPPQEKNT